MPSRPNDMPRRRVDRVPEMVPIGQRVRRLRRERRWSLKHTGAQVGVTGQMISKIEQARCRMSAELTVGLAKAFGVTCDYLLRGVGE